MKVKIFTGIPIYVEKDINEWISSCPDSTKFKIHSPVLATGGHIVVLVEYSL